MNESPWPLHVMTRVLGCLGHPVAGLVVVALLGYGFVVLVLSGVVPAIWEELGVSKSTGALWLVLLAVPWILAAAGFIAWSLWRPRYAGSSDRLRPVAWVVLALVAAGIIMEISALSWGIMGGRTCDYSTGGDALRACEEAAAAAAHGPSMLRAIAAPILLVTVPLAPALALHRIRLRNVARDIEGSVSRAAHSFQIVRFGGTYLLGAGVFAWLFQFMEWGLVSELVAYARGYSFTWMLGYLPNPPLGVVVVGLVWIPLAILGPLLGIVLFVQASLMRLAGMQGLDAGDRERFRDLIGRDALADALDGNWAGFWIAVGTMLALLFLVVVPAVSVILVGDCRDCEGFVHSVWPMLAVLNVVTVAACAVHLAAALALLERTLRGRRLREAALAPSQRLESLYAGGSITRKQFEENRSLAQAFVRNRPPGESHHTAGNFLVILLPSWVMALIIWLLSASYAGYESQSDGHLVTFLVEVVILVVPATILMVALMTAGWSMSALGKQETRESFLELQQRTEQLLHQANKRQVRG